MDRNFEEFLEFKLFSNNDIALGLRDSQQDSKFNKKSSKSGSFCKSLSNICLILLDTSSSYILEDNSSLTAGLVLCSNAVQHKFLNGIQCRSAI